MKGFAVDVAVERPAASGEPFVLEAAFETDGPFTVVFGPSGAGKSTLLLAILGALRPSRGTIVVADRVLFDSRRGIDLPTRERRLGIVFQDALLFPHLDARRNAAFGIHGPDRLRRADEMLERVGAAALAPRHPDELSGGERQRIALARALAASPAGVLLDEPFSALDGASREALGGLVIRLQGETGLPFLHVTHDLGEALRLGTSLVVLDAGRVLEVGPPAALLSGPARTAAARAVGFDNVFTGTVLRHAHEEGWSEVDLGGTIVETGLLPERPDSRVALGLRSNDVLVSLERVSATSARNVIEGTIVAAERRGTVVELVVETPVHIRAAVTPAAAAALRLSPGRRAFLLVKALAFHRLS